ncbi:MAG TPA: hypothetical protein DCG54_08485 [Anaerolineae bacterium]|jgi:nucleoid-associated protein YgaU|nr:hypothetical protein [Anaerolineae bacterium]
MPLNFFKLQKLKISSYDTASRTISGLPFEVMFNPASISVKHQNKFSKLQGINTKGRTAKYAYTNSDEINLDIVLDGTGVNNFGVTTLFRKSVAKQIKQFMDKCFYMDGNIHEPKYLKIQWGDGVLQNFNCRLQSVDIEYSMFDKSGTALHAVLKASFISDEDPDKRGLLENKSSPDLTHTRIVKSGDTLPLLSKEIYGSSQYYLRLAQVNKLDDFRNLTPGREIIFPPLDRNGAME